MSTQHHWDTSGKFNVHLQLQYTDMLSTGHTTTALHSCYHCLASRYISRALVQHTSKHDDISLSLILQNITIAWDSQYSRRCHRSKDLDASYLLQPRPYNTREVTTCMVTRHPLRCFALTRYWDVAPATEVEVLSLDRQPWRCVASAVSTIWQSPVESPTPRWNGLTLKT